jgi:hypothetical protein
MAPPKGDDNARSGKTRRTDSMSPDAYSQVDRHDLRGNRRWHFDESALNSQDEPERSTAREITFASGVIDTVAEPDPELAGKGVANNNAVAGAEPEPELPVRRSYVREGGAVAWTSPFAQPVKSADDEIEIPPLPEEALRPAALAPGPARASPWLLQAWVLLMCLILGAAALVAVRGEEPRSASPLLQQRDLPADAPVEARGAVRERQLIEGAPVPQAPAAPLPPQAASAAIGTAAREAQVAPAVTARSAAKPELSAAPSKSQPAPVKPVEKTQPAAAEEPEPVAEVKPLVEPAAADAPEQAVERNEAPSAPEPAAPAPITASGLPDNPYDAPAEPAAQ